SRFSTFWPSTSPPMLRTPRCTRLFGDGAAAGRILTAAGTGHHLAQAYLSVLYGKGWKGGPADVSKAVLFARKSLPWLQIGPSGTDHLGALMDLMGLSRPDANMLLDLFVKCELNNTSVPPTAPATTAATGTSVVVATAVAATNATYIAPDP